MTSRLSSPKISRATATGQRSRKDLHARFRDGEDAEIREEVKQDEEPDNGARFISLSAIRTDGGTQSRDGLSAATVQEYAEAMQAGKRFPALVVVYDGTEYWLADGFHRHAAAVSAGIDLIECEVQQGTVRDAILYSVGANNNHGLPRTPEDKRRAVTKLLLDREWTLWSNGQIAAQCDVSRGLVDKMRHELKDSLPTVGSERTFINKHGQEVTMQTGNIGKGRVTLGPQEDAHPDEPSIDVDELDEPVAVEFVAGMSVRQVHSGQTGVVEKIVGSQIFVKTANGLRIYDKWNLEPFEAAPDDDNPFARASAMADEARRAIHWGSGSDGSQFKQRVKQLGYGDEIYDLLQPGAQAITDLAITAKEANSQLSKLVKARVAEQFPIGSIVKSFRTFGKVTSVSEHSIEVEGLDTSRSTTFYLSSTELSSMEEYEQAPKRHWADQHGEEFEKLVAKAGLQMADVLELLQPGAKDVRDLKAEYWDVHNRVAKMITAQFAERFPEGALVKTPNGHFGTIQGVRASYVAIKDHATGDWAHLQFDQITLATQEELDAALAAVESSGFERFDDYTDENIRAVAPALRRLLDYVEGGIVSPILGKDLAQVEAFLEDVELPDDEEEEDDEDET